MVLVEYGACWQDWRPFLFSQRSSNLQRVFDGKSFRSYGRPGHRTEGGMDGSGVREGDIGDGREKLMIFGCRLIPLRAIGFLHLIGIFRIRGTNPVHNIVAVH